MTSWQDFSRADFDTRLADKRAARRAADAAAAGQAGLFFVATPERGRKAPEVPAQLDGQADMFGDAESASVPRGAMCRCSAPATGPVICADGQDRYLCDDCREAEIRSCHERDTAADALGWPVCRKCGQALRYRPEIHRDVTAASNNPECYGPRS